MAYTITNDPELAEQNGWTLGVPRQRSSVVVEAKVVTVEHTNGHGFKTTAGDWLNFSKYAVPQPPMPSVGQRVQVGLDKSGFVRTVEAVSPENATTRTQSPVQPSAAPEPTLDTSAPVPEQPATPAPCVNTRDQQISRMNALSHATAIVTHNATISGATVRLEDVLACAEKLEAWITRSA